MLLFVLNLLAVGCGPLYVGAVSDWAKPTYGTESLRIALYALIPFFVLGVGCNYAASWRSAAAAAPPQPTALTLRTFGPQTPVSQGAGPSLLPCREDDGGGGRRRRTEGA